MKVTLWGTRGSIASPGPDTVRYGGNTSCVSVEGREGSFIVLDAGTGIRLLGQQLPEEMTTVHLLLTHLHMDHLQGLPFFNPLRKPGVKIHIWGPPSTTRNLRLRVLRYLSPPLFPVSLRELSNNLQFHELPAGAVEIGEFKVKAQLVIHPNPTIGYRIECGSTSMVYLPDHEPALGTHSFPISKEWTSGYRLAEGADVLIHDAQYTDEEYPSRAGFGHSSIRQAFKFGKLVEAKRFIPFHHDPSHGDGLIDEMIQRATDEENPGFEITPGQEGRVVDLNPDNTKDCGPLPA
jgi:phosphoribosyl 1,2-cyclic phosphodiesterase